MNKNFGIIELYCGKSGKLNFYNNQEIGIAKEMKKHGYRCYIFYPGIDSRIIEEYIENDITIVYCKSFRISNHSIYDLNILKKYNIDVVQLDADNQLFAYCAIKYLKKNNIKFYNYIGTITSDSNNCVKKRIMDLASKLSIRAYKDTKCFVKTKKIKERLEKYSICDVDIAPVGLDISIIPNVNYCKKNTIVKYNLPFDKKNILFVGRLDPYKKPKHMLELVSSLPDNYHGIIVGDGTMYNDIKSLVELKYSNRITIIRNIENIKIHELYAYVDYFVNFNDKEIFGMSILEAMYQGCNVIAINAPGPEYIINDNKNGFIVDSLYEMKDIIISNKKLDKKVIKDRVIENFTWKKTCDKFCDWIEK